MRFKPSDDVKYIKETIKKTEDPSYELAKDAATGVSKIDYRSDNHFTTKRYALLFEAGEYKDCDFEVGYYVQMAGLGRNAKGEDAVVFTASEGGKSGPFVPALNKYMPKTTGGSIPYEGSGLCLDTFWRSAENFSADSVQWAVSQAAPLRRVYVKNDLEFGDGGAYSSGGFLANAEVGGTCNYIANQQWFTRAAHFNATEGGAFSTVFVGCTGKTPENNSRTNNCISTVEDIPRVRVEKPFIVRNTKSGDYELHVPKATMNPELTIGPQLDDSNTDVRCFSNVKFYNILTETDAKITAELQAALDEGKDLVLCPGIFFLTQPLVVKTTGQVILGLGMATLVAPQDGSPCIRVQANTAGVRIASLVLEGSLQKTPVLMSKHSNSDNTMSLIDFGEPDKIGTSDPGDPKNPGLLSDLFTRVGGANLNRADVKTDVMVRIFSGNVVGDNLWLWRADHVRLKEGEDANAPEINDRYWQVRNGECYVKHAMQVFGNHVSMYGLFAEHATEEQVIWKGEDGCCCFFQSELPYDVLVDTYCHAGYHVDKDVKVHTAKGIGVYCNFTQHKVVATRGISFPRSDTVSVHNPFTIFLNGKHGSGITHVLKKGEEFYGVSVDDFPDENDPEKKNLHQLSRGWVGPSGGNRCKFTTVP
eukprot:jgi/Psemu1/193123/e_gw1.136.37.1